MKQVPFTVLVLLTLSNLFGQIDLQTNTFPKAVVNSISASPDLETVIDIECKSDFFTVNGSGDIQQWSLVNNTISGGDIVITNSGTSIALTGYPDPVFYSGKSPGINLKYYDSSNTWQDVSPVIQLELINGGAQGEDQYHMSVSINMVKLIHIKDGTTVTALDSIDFLTDYYCVADIAVDSIGQAYVFTGPGFFEPDSLKIYNSSGFLKGYPVDSLFTDGAYGSLILDNKLYVGIRENVSHPSSLIPINIVNESVELGTPIPFPYVDFYDLASCKESLQVSVGNEPGLKDRISIFPNPTTGVVAISNLKGDSQISVYGLDGKLLLRTTSNREIDISELQAGIYFFRIQMENKIITKRVVKY